MAFHFTHYPHRIIRDERDAMLFQKETGHLKHYNVFASFDPVIICCKPWIFEKRFETTNYMGLSVYVERDRYSIWNDNLLLPEMWRKEQDTLRHKKLGKIVRSMKRYFYLQIKNSFDAMHLASGCQFDPEPNIAYYLEHLDVVKFLDIILGVDQTNLGHAQLAAWLITFWIMDDALEKQTPNAIENAKKWIGWCSIQNEYGSILRDELEIWFESTQEEHKSNIDYVEVRKKSAGVCPTIAAMFVFVPSRRRFFQNMWVKETRAFISELRECSFLVGIDNDRDFKHGADINLSTALSDEELDHIQHASEEKYKISIFEILINHGLVAAKEAKSYRERFRIWAEGAPRYNN